MCKFISFVFRPDTMEVFFKNLEHHGETENALPKQARKLFREGHYLQTGEVECRVQEEDRKSPAECRDEILARWPRFVDCLLYALKSTGQERVIGGSLDVRGCDLKGVKLPEKGNG
jgi:hypothetical protein